VCKRFIKLVDFDKKTGSDVAGQIKRFLEECDLELPWCRGQGYDSTSKMSGEFEGGKNKNFGIKCLSLFLTHVLNLCGTRAVETGVEVKPYFGNV
jgi:hypothetical protein